MKTVFEELYQKIHQTAQSGHLSANAPCNLQQLVARNARQNTWFTPESIERGLQQLVHLLNTQQPFYQQPLPPQTAGQPLLLLGEVEYPLEWMHEILTFLWWRQPVHVYITHGPNEWLKWLQCCWQDIAPQYADWLQVIDQLPGRYPLALMNEPRHNQAFLQYMQGPGVHIRPRQAQVALLTGYESDKALSLLAGDVLNYYGITRRNISKLYLPQGFDLNRLFQALYPFRDIIQHQKYGNQYDYNRSLFLLDRAPITENGFFMLKQDAGFFSPVATLHYEYYSHEAALIQSLNTHPQVATIEMEAQASPKAISWGKLTQHNMDDWLNKENLRHWYNQSVAQLKQHAHTQ